MPNSKNISVQHQCQISAKEQITIHRRCHYVTPLWCCQTCMVPAIGTIVGLTALQQPAALQGSTHHGMQGGEKPPETTLSFGNVTLHGTFPTAPWGACSAAHCLILGVMQERRAQSVWPVDERSADYLFSGVVQHSPDGARCILPQGWARGQVPPVQVGSLAHVHCFSHAD